MVGKKSREWYEMTDEQRTDVWQTKRDKVIARGKANYARQRTEDMPIWYELSWREMQRWIDD